MDFEVASSTRPPAFSKMDGLSDACKEPKSAEQNQQQCDGEKKNPVPHDSHSCSVFVIGFDSNTDSTSLKDYFSKYGDVKSVKITKSKNSFAFVEFGNTDSVQVVISRNIRHLLRGRKLIVKKKKHRVDHHGDRNPENILVNPVELSASLKECDSIQGQIDMMYNTLRLSEEDIAKRLALRSQLEHLFRAYFPKCTVTIFGSTTSGLGFKGCDLDILFEANHEAENMNVDEEIVVPSVNDVKKGIFPISSLSKLSKFDELRFIKKVLNYSYQFSKIILISAAKCPIIKLTSKMYSLNCDLSNGPRYPIHNTALLELVGKLDRRVIHMMFVLRYWVRNFCRPNSLNSYAFSLMVIFFLQTRQPAVLPTIKHIQSKADVPVLVDNCNCTVPSPCEAKKIEASLNTQTTEDLIAEFFAYYGDLDVANCVICPLTGSLVSKNMFELEVFKVAPLCVQDPFQTNYNVTLNVRLPVLMHLTECFIRAREAFSRSSPSNDIWGILEIFKSPPAKRAESQNNGNNLEFEIFHSNDMLSQFRDKFNDITCLDTSLSRIWVLKATEILLDVLSHGLLFDYEIIDLSEDKCKVWRKKLSQNICDGKSKNNGNVDIADPVNRNRNAFYDYLNSKMEVKSEKTHHVSCKGEGPSESSDDCNTTPFLTAQFTVKNCTWVGRDLVKPNDNSKSDPLDYEHHVAMDMMLKWNTTMTKIVVFNLEMREQLRNGYVVLLGKLMPFEENSEVIEIGKFLKLKILKTVEKVLFYLMNLDKL